MTAQSREEEEREPLLSNGNGNGDSTYGTSSTLTPTSNGSHSSKITGGDVEANGEAIDEDPEAQKARKNVRMMLPALAIGVSSLPVHYRASKS